MSTPAWVIRLDGGNLPDRALIGGKAWSIARMLGLGLPVPPAFVITTDTCRAFMASGDLPSTLLAEAHEGIAWLQSQTGRQFGGTERPLLLSVRSGAMISMPGMMDTVLNLGMNDATERALAAESALPDFARDTHRRFLELYASIVLKGRAQASAPQEPALQLAGAIRAVFESWNSRRAVRYREHHGIAHDLGTAVTVQAMVFGNLDERSGTGVVFSRNPLTGAPGVYGEYLPRAQGEDVVSGRFNPRPLDALRDQLPAAHQALLEAAGLLEREHRDVQDIEFTVESGKLYLLQARTAKRAAPAAVRAAVDMVAEGMIDQRAALQRVTPDQVKSLLLPRLRAGAADAATVLARGEGACPGVATGVLVTDPDEAERREAAGESVILLRATTSPDDLHGMIAARAVITEQGGATSHAAVVSRSIGRPCVVGIGGASGLTAGTEVTVDGAAGTVYAGRLGVEVPRESDDAYMSQLIAWARERAPVQAIASLTEPVLPALLAIVGRSEAA